MTTENIGTPVTKTAPPPPLDFTYKTDGEHRVGARVEISWRLNPQLIGQFPEAEAHNLHVLLIVARPGVNGELDDDETDRYLLPLADRSHTLRLDHAGVNFVVATVVWDGAGSVPRLERTIFGRAGLDAPVFRNGQILSRFQPGYCRTEGQVTLRFDARPEDFAKAPPGLAVRFVGKFFKQPLAGDEWSFYLRFAVALLLLAPGRLAYIIIWYAFALLFTLAAAIWWPRLADYAALRHPFDRRFQALKDPPWELWKGASPSWWWTKDRWGREPRLAVFRFLNLPVAVAASTGAVLLHSYAGWGWPPAIGTGVVGAALLALVIWLTIGRKEQRKLNRARRHRQQLAQLISPNPPPRWSLYRAIQRLRHNRFRPYDHEE